MSSPARHRHRWIPVSFVFENEALDPKGTVLIRQPNVDKGRVYCVCMGCARHTYIETKWIGYCLGGSDDYPRKRRS